MYKISIYTILIIISFSLFSSKYDTKIIKAERNFEYGKYKETVLILNPIVNKISKITKSQLLKTYRLLALSSYYLKDMMNTKFYIKMIYLLQYDFQFDPVFTPPKFIDLAQSIFKQYKYEIEFNKNFLDKYKSLKNPNYSFVKKKSYMYKNFIPFGIGQFQNGHTYKGYLLLSIESILLTINLGTYLGLKYYQRDDNTFPNSDLAKTGKIFNNISLYILTAVYIYGVADSFVYFNATQKIKVLQTKKFKILPFFDQDRRFVLFQWSF